jgi:hypothetical protein
MADNDEPENRLIAERRAKLAKLRDGDEADDGEAVRA